jgi:hypothetical protein
MTASSQIPMVRCRLDGAEEAAARTLRYVPLSEFGLWRYLMEHRHRRQVIVEEVSVWIAEDAARWNSGFAAEELEPVLRVRFDCRSRQGLAVTVERFFPAETYPEAQEALLHHYERVPPELAATPGYFVPVHARAPQLAGSAY